MNAPCHMDSPARDLLAALQSPILLGEITPARLTDIIGRARSSGVLGRLAARSRATGPSLRLPARLQQHFQAAATQAKAHQRIARFEVDRLRRALGPLGEGMILLKGAAYVVADLPAANGRHSGDVDILFARERLPEIEACLLTKGWVQEYAADYTQEYYRQWMHELPPLRHATRLAVVDLHHTILPLTNRLHPDPTALIARSVQIPGVPGVRTLDPCDMVLHIAAHLAQDGDFNQSLREVVDLDDLVKVFSKHPDFWSTLASRAEQHQLGRPLHYALSAACDLLRTPVPEDVRKILRTFGPSPWANTIITGAMATSLAGSGRSRVDPLTRICREGLYMRSHWLRMPPLMLARHLGRKIWSRLLAALTATRR